MAVGPPEVDGRPVGPRDGPPDGQPVRGARPRQPLPQRLARLWSDLRVEVPATIARRIAVDNVRRIRTVCALALLISVTSLTLFTFLEPADAVEATWRWRILGGHGVLLALVASVLVVTNRPSWREPGVPAVATRRLRGLEWTVVSVLLAAGCYFTWADQVVTDSITPFVTVCVLVGTLILVHPARSTTAFALAAVVFALLMAATPDTGASVAASNQVNGVAAAVLGLMLAVVRYTSEVRSLVQEAEIEQQRAALERANAALTHTAAHDELTSLVNRREANRCIAAEVERLRRSGGAASLLLLDIDHFKRVNDLHGHPAGDELLVRIAEVLRTRLRRVDLVARWGGEEFLVLLVATDLAGARAVAEDLRGAIAGRSFDLGPTGPAAVTVSVGVAPLEVELADPMASAYREVDEALYAAKAAGRNRVVASRDGQPVPA